MINKSSKIKLLAGASVFVMGSLASGAANAVDVPTTTTTATAAGFLMQSTAATIAASQSITAHATPTAVLIRVDANSGNLTMSGTLIQGDGDAGTAGTDTIATTGDNTDWVFNVTAGTVTSDGVNGAQTMDIDHSIGTIVNAGTIQSSNTNANVIDLATTKTIIALTNSSGGLISANGSGSAIDIADGANITTITNAGTIRSTTSGIAVDFVGAMTGSLTNTGTILSTTTGNAIHVGGAQTGGITNGSASVSSALLNSTGGVALNVAGNVSLGIDNYGSITETSGTAVDLAAAQTTATTGSFDNKSGGRVSAATGVGIDIGADVIAGVINAGTVSVTTSGSAIQVTGAMTNSTVGGSIQNSGSISAVGGIAINVDAHIANSATAGSGGIVNTGTISSTSGNFAAIDIANSVNGDITNTGGMISAAGSVAAILDQGTTQGHISNTGTIKGTGTGGAINIVTNLDYAAGDDGDITNTGGLITAGTSAAADTIILGTAGIDGTLTNTGTISATATGAISAISGGFVVDGTGAANGVMINNSGLITAAGTGDTIALGDIDAVGTIINTGTISNTSTGKVLDLSGESASGITLTQTAGAITAGSATTGAIEGGGGADTFNWHGGTVTGTIDLGSETADTINIGNEATDSITTGGAISGTSVLNVDFGTFSIGHTVTLTNATEADENFELDSATTTSVTASVAITAADVDVGGTLKVADAKTLTLGADTTGNVDVAAAGVLKFVVNNDGTSNTFGKIDNQTTGTNDFTFATATSSQKQIYIDVTGATKMVVAGTLTDVIKSDAININGTALSSSNYTSIGCDDNSYVLTCALSSTSDATGLDVVLTRTNAYNTASATGHISAVGAALESIANSGNNALDTIVAALDAKTTAAAVAESLETLTPKVDGSNIVAVSNATNQAIGTASDRLASLRLGNSGIATGSAFQNSAVWLQGFGSSADQGDRKGVRGYQSDTYGFALGADTQIADKSRLGISFTYGNSDVDSFRGTNEIDSYQGTVYGDYDEGEWYLEGLLAVSFNDFETTRTLFDSSIARADSDGISYSGKIGGGYRVPLEGGLNVTPVASLQYTFIDNDGYTETGSNANLTVDPDDTNILESGLGIKLDYPIVDGGITYVPQLKAQWLYDFIGDNAETTSRFTSSTVSFVSKGADPAQHTFNFGAGLDIHAQNNVTVSLDYDLNEKADYSSHAGSIKARFAF